MLPEFDGTCRMSDKKAFPEFGGVYFVYDTNDETVLYIGKTGNIAVRVSDIRHHALSSIPKLEEKQLGYIRSENQEKCRALEIECITKYKPLLNKAHNDREDTGVCNVSLSVMVNRDLRRKFDYFASQHNKTASEFARELISIGIESYNPEQKDLLTRVSAYLISRCIGNEDQEARGLVKELIYFI